MAQGPGAGDFTGRQKQKLAAQHAQEQAEAAQRMAIAAQVEEQQKRDEIVDYTTKTPKAAEPAPGPVDVTVTPDDEHDPTIDAIVAQSGGAVPAGTVGEPEDLTEGQSEAEAPAPVEVRKPSRKVRARYNLNKVTVGAGTMFDFEVGRTYLVPPHVAAHLEERELVDVLD